MSEKFRGDFFDSRCRSVLTQLPCNYQVSYLPLIKSTSLQLCRNMVVIITMHIVVVILDILWIDKWHGRYTGTVTVKRMNYLLL